MKYEHDGCKGCAFVDMTIYEEPCKGCKQAVMYSDPEYKTRPDLWEPAKEGKTECEVCGSIVIKKRTGTCRKILPFIDEPVYYDYMNCPGCGCQIILQQRYMDVNEVDE